MESEHAGQAGPLCTAMQLLQQSGRGTPRLKRAQLLRASSGFTGRCAALGSACAEVVGVGTLCTPRQRGLQVASVRALQNQPGEEREGWRGEAGRGRLPA